MREVNFGWLREAVRKEIRNAFEVQGYARPREVAQVVCALYRKGVSQMGERLVENAIAAMARRELKRYPATTECTQLRVPGIPGALMAHLPPAISVPASGVDEEALSEDSVISDLGIDSLGMLELIGSMEREMQITIPDEQLVGIQKVRQLLDLIERRTQAQG